MTAAPRLSGFRWTICALVFFAMTVNYLDRQVFSLLVPYFENDLRLSPTDLALINVGFALPYGLAMTFVGRWIDRVGVGRGLRSTFLLWNVASIAHAFVTGLGSFVLVRALLGIGECGMYPSAVKTSAEWFPQKERATANGLFNAGANMGALLAPLLGVGIAQAFGWRVCFVVTGLVGMAWIPLWNRFYRPPAEHPRVRPEELAHIRSDAEPRQPALSYAQLFALRPVYGLALAKALTDAPWWFYLTWMPKFLTDQFHVTPGFMALAIPVVYLVADVGSVFGGFMSSRLIARGMAVGPARKLTMLACAVAVVPVASVGGLVDHAPILGIPAVFLAVAATALAAGAHQGWSANLFTLISDTVPKNGVAVAVGAINGFSMVGVSAFQFFVGRTVQNTDSYTLPFMLAGSLYLIALAALQIVVPHVRPADTTRRADLRLVGLAAGVVLSGLVALQVVLNKPPYASMGEYLAKRGGEIKADGPAVLGPEARVGWMDARWVAWPEATGRPKLELVKLDAQSRPYVEGKGTQAARYAGPKAGAVSAALGGF